MSSDAEDYDGDTDWGQIAAIRESISPRRNVHRAQAPSPAPRSLSRPTAFGRNENVTYHPHIPASASRGTQRSLFNPTFAAGLQRSHTNARSEPTSRSSGSSRVQNIIDAQASTSSDHTRKAGPSGSNSVNNGKRKRSNDDLDIARSKHLHIKENSPPEAVRKILNDYDEELSCPICLDFFLSPQLLNPCGHTVCGDCVEHWLTKGAHLQCPTCRAHLSYPCTYLPNFAIGGAVDKYIELQRVNKNADWLEGGAKWKERQKRKRAYDVMKEMKKNNVTKPIAYPRPMYYDLFVGFPREDRLSYQDRRADSPPPPPLSPLPGYRRMHLAQRVPQDVIQISSDDDQAREDDNDAPPANVAAGPQHVGRRSALSQF